ncbi:tyrosine-protein phosphatase non-receptor type 22 isoform X2 [Clupea harengus]|uniref:protein-tyrosine-phosphatase n=1 Tax=Clupea harengus TaxID=7950 RepID=A0A6P8FFE8_CLUHA|nr:tyrosine-protein phosphatase non-receptor type 22 isoform X2 [Clupea harengus]
MDTQVPILRGFLAEVACKEAVQGEAENSFNGEFSRLKRQSTKIRMDRIFPTKAAEKQDNVKKNRYKDIVPFDHSRVRLTLDVSNDDSDYINASFIKGVSGERAYIATQGPLPHTVLDLWRMLWQYEVQVVVMACREFEMGRKKCERYWAANTEDVFVCEQFIVTCVSEEDKGDYVTRVLNVTYQSTIRTIRQLHYMNWPDHGVPDSIPPILELLQEMRGYQEQDNIPICIHCSAGCGRTGALCAIDYTWNLLKRQCIPENFSIFDLVQDMRTQRPSVVQTKEQYALVYRAVRFLFEHHLEALDVPCSPEQEEVHSPPSPITPDFSSDLSDLSETEMEPHVEPEPRLVNVLHMDIPVTHLSHQGLEVKPASVRRPEDILRSMAVKRPSHRPNTHTQSISQTTHSHTPSHTHALSNQIPVVTHTHLTHSQSITDDNTSAAPFQQITHTQMPPQVTPTQQAIPVMHTSQVVQIPLIQQLTHTQQRAHVAHTSHTAHTQRAQQDEKECVAAPPHPPDLCVSVEDPYFSPALSPTTEECSANGHRFRPPQLTLNEQPLQQCSQPHTVAVKAPASDDEEPPCLPERTPESFVLPTGTERQLPRDPTPTENGVPPCPVPSLPQRTPESFELVSPDELERTMDQLKLTDSVGKVGLSSEWSGTPCTSPATKRSCCRSKVRMSLPESPKSLTPPLPERTPESFIVPTDEEVSKLTKTLLVIQPSNMAGAPPSPVPPLPERTPESFELPLADVPGMTKANKRRSMLCLNDVVLRENTQRTPRCTSAIFLSQDRSLSLSPNSALCPNGRPQLTLSNAATPCEPGDSQQQSAQRSSATLLAEAPLSGSPLRTEEEQTPLQRIGSSSEWAGPSQAKAKDPIMYRSKSVKVKSSKPAPLTVIAPNVAISTEAQGAPAVGASVAGPTEQQEAGATGNAEMGRESGKAMTRKKSWKRLIPKHKQKSAPPSAPLAPLYGAVSGFRFMFGQRFGKPKGPRSRPETWV